MNNLNIRIINVSINRNQLLSNHLTIYNSLRLVVIINDRTQQYNANPMKQNR